MKMKISYNTNYNYFSQDVDGLRLSCLRHDFSALYL